MLSPFQLVKKVKKQGLLLRFELVASLLASWNGMSLMHIYRANMSRLSTTTPSRLMHPEFRVVMSSMNLWRSLAPMEIDIH